MCAGSDIEGNEAVSETLQKRSLFSDGGPVYYNKDAESSGVGVGSAGDELQAAGSSGGSGGVCCVRCDGVCAAVGELFLADPAYLWPPHKKITCSHKNVRPADHTIYHHVNRRRHLAAPIFVPSAHARIHNVQKWINGRMDRDICGKRVSARFISVLTSIKLFRCNTRFMFRQIIMQ
jgi:hypothetical protein